MGKALRAHRLAVERAGGYDNPRNERLRKAWDEERKRAHAQDRQKALALFELVIYAVVMALAIGIVFIL